MMSTRIIKAGKFHSFSVPWNFGCCQSFFFSTVFLFIFITFCQCQGEEPISWNVTISPDQVIEAGDKFLVTCTLSGNNDEDDFQWLKSGDILLRSDDPRLEFLSWQGTGAKNITMLVHLSTFNDSSNYSCAKSGNILATTNVQVGLPPINANHLTCTSNNMETMWCWWTEVPETYLPISYLFTYRLLNTAYWDICPDNTTKGPHSCYFSKNHFVPAKMVARVTASNFLGAVDCSIEFWPDRETTPNPVENFRAIPHQKLASIILKWNLPKGWNKFYDLKYKIEYYSEWEQDKIEIKYPQENVLEANFPDLEQSTNYTFRIAAKPGTSGGFFSDWSPWKSAQTIPTGPIRSVEIEECTEEDNAQDPNYLRDVTCFWKPYKDRVIMGQLQRYIVFADNIVKIGQPNATEVKLIGLNKYKMIEIQILVSNGAYNSTSHYKLLDKTGIPGAPSNFRAVSSTWHSIRLTWGLPKKPNGIISNYTLKYKIDDVNERYTKLSINNKTYSKIVDDLKAFTPYVFVLMAHTMRGHGSESSAEQTTLETVPNAPPLDLREDENNKPHKHAKHLHLFWRPPPKEHQRGIIRGYYLYYCLTDKIDTGSDTNFTLFNNETELVTRLNFSMESGRIDHLQPFTLYTFWVSAFTAAGEGNASFPQQFKTGETAPADPPIITSIDLSSSSVRLTWQAPLQPNGVIVQYQVHRMCLEGTDRPGQNLTSHTGSQARSLVLKGLHGFTNYSIQVAACNTFACTTSAATYVFTQAGEPSLPRDLSFNRIDSGNSKVQVKWSPPNPSNGPLFAYDIFYVDEKYVDRIRVPAGDLSIVVTVNCSSAKQQRRFHFFMRAVVKSPAGGFFLGQNTSDEIFYLCDEGTASDQMTLNIIVPIIIALLVIFVFFMVTLVYHPKIIKYYKIYIVGVVPDPKPFPGYPKSISPHHSGSGKPSSVLEMKPLESDFGSMDFGRQHSYETMGLIKEVFDPLIEEEEELGQPPLTTQCLEKSRISTSSDSSGTSSRDLPAYLGVTAAGQLRELAPTLKKSPGKISSAPVPVPEGKGKEERGDSGHQGRYSTLSYHRAGSSSSGDSYDSFQLSPPFIPLTSDNPQSSPVLSYLSKSSLAPHRGDRPLSGPQGGGEASASSIDTDQATVVCQRLPPQSYVKLSQPQKQRPQSSQLARQDSEGPQETQPMLPIQTTEGEDDLGGAQAPLLADREASSEYVITPNNWDSATTSVNPKSPPEFDSDSDLSNS